MREEGCLLGGGLTAMRKEGCPLGGGLTLPFHADAKRKKNSVCPH